MNKILAFLISLPATIAAWLSRAPAPTKPLADPTATLTQLILANTEAIGPMPKTGGVIHVVDATTAARVAALVVKYAALYHVPISFLASTLRGESDFDPRALDPNDQDAKPGETPAAAILHADVGEAQGDIAAVRDNPDFAGLTSEQIEAKLFDPDEGVKLAAEIVAKNLAWAKASFVADPLLVGDIPNGDYRVLAAQAYNAGQHGAIGVARAQGVTANWTYGLGVVKRADGWAELLDG